MNATDQHVYHKVAASKKKAMTLDQLQTALPSMNAKVLKSSVNSILKIRMFQAEQLKDGVVLFHAVEKADAEKQKTLTEEQKVVLSVVATASNKGISKSAIAAAMSSEMSKVQVNRFIDTLEKQGHIRSFKGIQNPVTPLYILANLDPPEEISGGIWYDENKEYDDHLVSSLLQVLYKYVSEKTYGKKPGSRERQVLPTTKTTGLPNPQTLLKHVKTSGILGSAVHIKVKNVMELMRALVLEGRVEILKPLGGVEFDADPDSESEDERPTKKRRKDGGGKDDDDDLDDDERERRARKKKEKEKAKLKARKKEEKRVEKEKRRKKKEKERKKKKKEEERRKKDKEKAKRKKEKEREKRKEKDGKKKRKAANSEDEESDEERLVSIDDVDSSKRGKASSSKSKSKSKSRKDGKRKRDDPDNSSDSDESDSDAGSFISDDEDSEDSKASYSDSESESDSDDSDEDSDSDVSSVASEDIDRLNTRYKPKTLALRQDYDASGSGVSTFARLDDLRDMAVVYRATQWPAVSLGHTQAPCGKCPQFSLCDEAGPVNSADCTYFGQWLSGEKGGWDADVRAAKEAAAKEARKKAKAAAALANGGLEGEEGEEGMEGAEGEGAEGWDGDQGNEGVEEQDGEEGWVGEFADGEMQIDQGVKDIEDM